MSSVVPYKYAFPIAPCNNELNQNLYLKVMEQCDVSAKKSNPWLKGFYISPWNEKNMIDVAILSSIICPSPFVNSNDLSQPLSVLSKMLSCCKRSTSTWVLIKASNKQDVFKPDNQCHINANLNSDPLVIMNLFENSRDHAKNRI